MKYILSGIGGVVGLLVVLIMMGIFTHIFDNRTRVGHFDVYTQSKVADSHVFSYLYYKRHLLTEYPDSYSIDLNNPDRILFSSHDTFHGPEGLCGTFLYDGQLNQLRQIRRWPATADWSSDSRFVLLDRRSPTVLDLATHEEVDLTASVSTNGERLEMFALEWSPSNDRVAGVIQLMPDKRTRDFDWDLVEITISPLSIRYVATMRGDYPGWLTEDISWTEGQLQAAAASPHGTILVKSPETLSWTATPPSVPRRPSVFESECSLVENKRR